MRGFSIMILQRVGATTIHGGLTYHIKEPIHPVGHSSINRVSKGFDWSAGDRPDSELDHIDI